MANYYQQVVQFKRHTSRQRQVTLLHCTVCLSCYKL